MAPIPPPPPNVLIYPATAAGGGGGYYNRTAKKDRYQISERERGREQLAEIEIEGDRERFSHSL